MDPGLSSGTAAANLRAVEPVQAEKNVVIFHSREEADAWLKEAVDGGALAL